MDESFVRHFAQDWICAWNSHDLARILAHYTDDFEMASPKIREIAHEASGILRGKAAVGEYWAKALAMHPELHFELVNTLVGAHSVTLYYRNHHARLAAEVFFFDAAGLVNRAAAHYAL